MYKLQGLDEESKALLDAGNPAAGNGTVLHHSGRRFPTPEKQPILSVLAAAMWVATGAM